MEHCTCCWQAVLWGQPPVVRKKWLLDSAAAGRPLPYDAFLFLVADQKPEPSVSDRRCGRVSCSSKLTSCRAAEPEVSTARAQSCSSPQHVATSADRSGLALRSASVARDKVAAGTCVRTEAVQRKDAEPARSPPEPERRRAAADPAAADAFGLDDLQPLYSPGAKQVETLSCCTLRGQGLVPTRAPLVSSHAPSKTRILTSIMLQTPDQRVLRAQYLCQCLQASRLQRRRRPCHSPPYSLARRWSPGACPLILVPTTAL